MQIALVCKSLDPSRGGHERYMNRLIEGLTERGHRCTVFTRDASEKLRTGRVDHVQVPCVSLGGAVRRLTFNYAAKYLVHERREAFDLVFTTGKLDFGDVHRSGGGVHQVFLEECEHPVRRWLPKHLVACRLERRLYESDIERLIVNSQMVRDQILERFNASPERIQVIYNGVDTDRYDWRSLQSERGETRNKHGYDSSDFVCLFTGGSWKRKGLPFLLDALERIEDSKVRLLVAGHADERRLFKYAQRLGIEERVTYIGYTDALEYEYAAADAFVLPSRYDAAANVVLEALASGTPVVTTSTNGSSELVEEGKTGFVVERAEKIGEIARAIQQLRDVKDQEALRERAYSTGSKFTMQRHMDEMESTLQAVSVEN